MSPTPPVPGLDDAFFWDGVAAGELRLRHCASCGRVQHPPVPMCPACGSLEKTTRAADPHGRLLSWVLPVHPPAPDPAQRIVALVELASGARLVTNLQDADPATLVPDLPVEMVIGDVDGVPLPLARPATSTPQPKEPSA